MSAWGLGEAVGLVLEGVCAHWSHEFESCTPLDLGLISCLRRFPPPGPLTFQTNVFEIGWPLNVREKRLRYGSDRLKVETPVFAKTHLLRKAPENEWLWCLRLFVVSPAGSVDS